MGAIFLQLLDALISDAKDLDFINFINFFTMTTMITSLHITTIYNMLYTMTPQHSSTGHPDRMSDEDCQGRPRGPGRGESIEAQGGWVCWPMMCDTVFKKIIYVRLQ